jgi:hypothetical protein
MNTPAKDLARFAAHKASGDKGACPGCGEEWKLVGPNVQTRSHSKGCGYQAWLKEQSS